MLVVGHIFMSWAEWGAAVWRRVLQLGFSECQVTVKWFGFLVSGLSYLTELW